VGAERGALVQLNCVLPRQFLRPVPVLLLVKTVCQTCCGPHFASLGRAGPGCPWSRWPPFAWCRGSDVDI